MQINFDSIMFNGKQVGDKFGWIKFIRLNIYAKNKFKLSFRTEKTIGKT